MYQHGKTSKIRTWDVSANPASAITPSSEVDPCPDSELCQSIVCACVVCALCVRCASVLCACVVRVLCACCMREWVLPQLKSESGEKNTIVKSAGTRRQRKEHTRASDRVLQFLHFSLLLSFSPIAASRCCARAHPSDGVEKHEGSGTSFREKHAHQKRHQRFNVYSVPPITGEHLKLSENTATSTY